MNRATEAKGKTEEAKSKETETLSNYEDVLEEYANAEIKLMKLIVNSGDSMEVTLPIKPNSENNYTIDWGDGTKEKVDPMAYATHTYSSASTEYTVTIDGTVKEIDAFNDWNSFSSDSIVKVAQWGELGLTKVNFYECYNLVEIVSPTKNSFKDVTDFSSAFDSTSITSIPENLFANCPNVTDFSDAFHETSITSIPENLFANCPNVTYFSYAFGDTSITSIPENLFANCPNVTDFSGAFWDTSITSIPENLFANCPNVKYFSDAFYKTSITSIPENLFANCPNVTDFSGAFRATSITSIPEKLFDNCMKVKRFRSTFSSCTELKGLAIELWTRGDNDSSNNYQGTPDGRGCFSGCEQLENYEQIPSYWKDSIEAT